MLLESINCFVKALNGVRAGDNSAEIYGSAVKATFEPASRFVQVAVNRYGAVAFTREGERSFVICHDEGVAKNIVDRGLVISLRPDERRSGVAAAFRVRIFYRSGAGRG